MCWVESQGLLIDLLGRSIWTTILTISLTLIWLSGIEEADFKFLCMVTGLTKGNLSRQSAQLEEAGYIEIRKYYKGRIPATGYQLTAKGREAFADYWQQMSTLQKHFQA